MGIMHDVEWRVRVELAGERGWWWITAPFDRPVDVTRDVRLAAPLIDPDLAGLMVDALSDRRERQGLGVVLKHEVRRADES